MLVPISNYFGHVLVSNPFCAPWTWPPLEGRKNRRFGDNHPAAPIDSTRPRTCIIEVVRSLPIIYHGPLINICSHTVPANSTIPVHGTKPRAIVEGSASYPPCGLVLLIFRWIHHSRRRSPFASFWARNGVDRRVTHCLLLCQLGRCEHNERWHEASQQVHYSSGEAPREVLGRATSTGGSSVVRSSRTQ